MQLQWLDFTSLAVVWGVFPLGFDGPASNGLFDILSEEPFRFHSPVFLTKYLWNIHTPDECVKTSSNGRCMKIRLNAHSEMISNPHLVQTLESLLQDFLFFFSSSFRPPCFLKGHWSFRELLVFITNDDAILQSKQTPQATPFSPFVESKTFVQSIQYI